MGKGSGSSGSGQNTVVNNSQPPQVYLDAYSQLLQQAQAQQQQPLQQYTGQLVAPFNNAQNQAFGITGQAATDLSNFGNPAAPYINSSADAYSAATQPLWSGVQQFSPSNVQQYESPYTQDVVNATQEQFNQSNAIQQSQLQGNAINQGAFGGDRAAVAQSVLAGQQQLNQAPVIANLENQGYSQALNEFNTQQTNQLGANQANAWLSSQAASGTAALGQEAFNTQLGGINANLAGANADLGIGAIQQAQTQQELNVPYEQFVQQQAYPWQTIGWLGGITQGLGTSAGGTASTNYPTPSTGSQVAGALLGGAGLVGATGGFGSNGYLSQLFGGGSSAPAGTGMDPSLFAGQRGGRISHHADGGIVIPFRGRHRAAGGIVAANDDYDDTPMPRRAAGGGFGMPDLSLSFIPSGGGIVGGNSGDAATGPRMLSGKGSTSTTTGMPTGSASGNPLAGIEQLGAREGIKSLIPASKSGTMLPGAPGTYADPADAPNGIMWNATNPEASTADLSTSGAGDDVAALTSTDSVGALDAGQLAALSGTGAETGLDAATLAELAGTGEAIDAGVTAAELADVAAIAVLAKRGGRIPRHAPGGLVVPHLSPLQGGPGAHAPVDVSYHPPDITWNASQTQPGPLPMHQTVAAPPPAVLTNTTSDPGAGDPSADGGPGGGSGGEGGGDGGGDGGGGGDARRGGLVRRRAPGGIVGYDDGGDVDETQMSILARSPDPATYFNDPQFSPKLVQDAVNARRAAAEPAQQPSSPRGPVYTGRRPPPGPTREPMTETGDGDEPFLGYRSPLRGGMVPQRRDPEFTMPSDDEPLGSPEQDYRAAPDAYTPDEDYDWPPPDLPAHAAPAPGGIVADGGGNAPMPPVGRPRQAPADGGLVPPSGYENTYRPRPESGRAAEAKSLAPWLAMIDAGGSMLASKSPYFGVGLGEGLKAGAKSYGEGRKEADRMAEREDEQRDTGNYHKSNLDMQAKRFSDAAEHAKKTLQAQTEHYADEAEHQAAVQAETSRHNKATEGKGYWEPVRALTNDDGSPQVDKDGTPLGVWIDRTTNRTETRPLADPGIKSKPGAVEHLANSLLSSGQFDKLPVKERLPAALAFVRDPANKNSQSLNGARDRLAGSMAKADPEFQSDPTATIKKWRDYYQVGGQGSGAMGTGAPAVGSVVKGYKFLGGNPADQDSWEKQ